MATELPGLPRTSYLSAPEIARKTARIPKTAFKFFGKSALPSIEKGVVRIGTSAGFRRQDGYDDGRADPRELIKQYNPRDGVLLTADHPFIRGYRSENILFRNLEPPSDFTGIFLPADASLLVETDCFMLCLSASLSDDLKKQMLEKFGSEYYYKIADLSKYVDAISKSDVRLKDSIIGRVAYGETDEEIYEERLFVKPSKFA